MAICINCEVFIHIHICHFDDPYINTMHDQPYEVNCDRHTLVIVTTKPACEFTSHTQTIHNSPLSTSRNGSTQFVTIILIHLVCIFVTATMSYDCSENESSFHSEPNVKCKFTTSKFLKDFRVICTISNDFVCDNEQSVSTIIHKCFIIFLICMHCVCVVVLTHCTTCISCFIRVNCVGI